MMLQLQTRPFVGSLLLTLFLTDCFDTEAKDILNRYVS